MRPDTAPVRHGEELNAARLSAWLHSQLPDAGTGLSIEQFPNGHSNLVYLIRTGGQEYVLRRPPLGPVAPKAHDMAREFRVLDAVHSHFPEAPRVFLLCEDPAIAGATFFLMERRNGIVLRDEPPSEWASIPDYPAKVSEAFIDCLVRLQQIDVSEPKLAALGRPEGFLERLVRGGATFTMASDAHQSERVGARANDIATMLERHGVHELATYEGRQRVMKPLRAH